MSSLAMRFRLTISSLLISSFFFFNDTATTEIYTLSLHDALPISGLDVLDTLIHRKSLRAPARRRLPAAPGRGDRKSTRLNSSHLVISYAVFCLKKKKNRRIRVAALHRNARP